MLKNLILSAAAAGVAAGLFTAVVQHVTTTPIILQAEQYESGTAPHSHDHGVAAGPGQAAAADASSASAMAEAEEWTPADGVQRTL
jgi:predicted cobalt transporter CbtA